MSGVPHSRSASRSADTYSLNYRPEIDGLRAVAVLPVILFHSGFRTFSGGFVGVDVFFVISGYLITSILLAELRDERFSLLTFYERRARRILPALFVAMLVSSVAGYFLLMPDEFKSFGQSLAATAVFSNNFLLALTTGYWDLAGHFKPLLHTWSLSVEEQFYLIFPLLLLLTWRYASPSLKGLLFILFLSSLALSFWLVFAAPAWAFYTLPTRAWELLAGALLAVFSRTNSRLDAGPSWNNVLSLSGLLMIVFPVFVFDGSVAVPGPLLLLPVAGTMLILAFSLQGTVVHRILSSSLFVFVGLLSYSLYIWHQPVLAFLRAYAKGEPDNLSIIMSLIFVFFLSVVSWKFVETPFRKSKLVGQRAIFALTIFCSAGFLAFGLYLNASYGMMRRVYDGSVRIEDMDKRAYNSRVYSYKKDTFLNDGRKKILILGNSFARDFVNITTETFDTTKVEIVYRDDLNPCVFPFRDPIQATLLSVADVIVFASGRANADCVSKDVDFAERAGKQIYYIGTKNFGYNLNWLIWLSPESRPTQYNTVPSNILKADEFMRRVVPPDHYISLMLPVVVDGAVPITDHEGRMISTDGRHLTKYGAVYFGENVVSKSPYAELFN